jgi:hypothetical protein
MAFAPHKDMLFLQEFYLGFTRQTPAANAGVYAHIPDTIRVASSQVDTAAGYAGSCHVLEMGRHYSEYVRYRGRFPSFPPTAGFPAGDYLRQLDTKSRASNVTGNIGEIVGGLVARRTLKIKASHIAHLKANTFSQTPDYLLGPSPRFESIIRDIVPLPPGTRLPDWWPMETKARGDKNWKSAVRDALRQLAAYWYDNCIKAPHRVGYGITVAVELARPRRVRVVVFVPSNQAALTTHLKSFSEYEKYRDDFIANPWATGTHLMRYA